MNKEDNLRPCEYKFSREEQSRGGIASGIAKRKRKELRECLEMLLEKEMTSKSGEKMSGAEAISAKLFEQALKGNVKAFETVRSTVGQDPVQKIMVAEVEQEVIDEVEAIVRGTAPAAEPAKPTVAVDLSGKIQQIDKDTGAIINTFSTAAKAARECKIDASNLSKAIKSGAIVGGFKWQKRKD